MEQSSQHERIRHSLSHIMTAAVQELWPTAKLGVGPAIETGFYQDYDLPEKITEANLPKLEKRMRELIKQKLDFVKEIKSRAEALAFYKDDPFKTELINEFTSHGETEVQFYKIGNSTQLCAGGHIENTSEIDAKAFKLLSVAGAYWRGDQKNKMLTRIYGAAFASAKELTDYLQRLAEAKERDHRKLGRELDLFTFSELVGPGLPLWTPHGTIVRQELDKYIWELRRQYHYQPVTIPHLAKKELYETSGHWEKFGHDLFKIETREGHVLALKPMNCPHHAQIYKRKLQSYRDLPCRFGETTMVY